MAAGDERLALAISQRHGLPDVLGQLLASRGVALDAVPRFMEPRIRDWLPDPSHLLGLDVAAARLAQAVLDREPVGLIGDYDVDGLTSSALMARYLEGLSVPVTVVIPDRLGEGYGASAAAFDQLAGAGCRLCVTLDNGTTAFEALAHAADAGQEVIVVDHHAAEAELPPALAVVNPNRLDQTSPLGDIAAVGLTFVVIVAVNRVLRRTAPGLGLPDPLRWLDLVALGTACDVVPLKGLNRAFVHQGLKRLATTELPGLDALARVAGIARIDACHQLGFALGPRINAASRMGEAGIAARLLMTEDPAEAELLAARLQALNLERRDIERQILEAAEQAIAPQLAAGRTVLLATGEGWHAGVIGIVASRLVERHHRPAFVVASGAGGGKGSARSVPGYDVGAVVIAARRAGLLARGGGHAMAAGLTLAAEMVEPFHAFAEQQVLRPRSAPVGGSRPLDLDGTLTLAGASVRLAQDLARMAPFGAGNSEPRFVLADARPVDAREAGQGHVRCWLAGETGSRLKAIAFRCEGSEVGRALREIGRPLRLAGRLRVEQWQGQVSPCFEIEDAAPA